MIVYQIQQPIRQDELEALLDSCTKADIILFTGSSCACIPPLDGNHENMLALSQDMTSQGNAHQHIRTIEDDEWVQICSSASSVISWF